MAKCPNCGKEVSEGFRFCTNCGEKLEPVEPAQSAEPAAATAEEAPVTEPSAEAVTEPVSEALKETAGVAAEEAPATEPAAEVPVEPINEVPVSNTVNEVPVTPVMPEAAYSEPTTEPLNAVPEEKKKQPPYFLIGVSAVALLVLIAFVALGKILGGLNPIRLLGVGTPGQKFLGYQVDYFNGKMKALEGFGLLRMDDKRALTLTMTGEVKGNKEIAEHLKYSSVVLKTKSNLDKGNLQASLEVYLMGNF